MANHKGLVVLITNYVGTFPLTTSLHSYHTAKEGGGKLVMKQIYSQEKMQLGNTIAVKYSLGGKSICNIVLSLILVTLPTHKKISVPYYYTKMLILKPVYTKSILYVIA